MDIQFCLLLIVTFTLLLLELSIVFFKISDNISEGLKFIKKRNVNKHLETVKPNLSQLKKKDLQT